MDFDDDYIVDKQTSDKTGNYACQSRASAYSVAAGKSVSKMICFVSNET